MKKLSLILLLPLCVALPSRAQWDTVGHSSTLCENITMAATSTGLISLGLLAAYQPDVNTWAVSLRDEVMYHNPRKLTFDNQLQYLTTITPAVLNLCGLKGRHDFKRLALLEGGS